MSVRLCVCVWLRFTYVGNRRLLLHVHLIYMYIYYNIPNVVPVNDTSLRGAVMRGCDRRVHTYYNNTRCVSERRSERVNERSSV